MGFWDDEKSLDSSSPIELHAFVTETQEWLYADALENIDYDGDTYQSTVIHGDRIESGASAIRNRTTVKCEWELPFAWQYIQSSPDGIVEYTRTRLQGSNGVTLFIGTVLDVEFTQKTRDGDREASIIIDPFTGDLETSGLILRYGRNCSVSVYSDLCGVDPDDSGLGVTVDGALDGVSGLTLTASEFALQADGWYEGGKILVNGRKRKIVSHVGTSIIVASTIPGVAVGQNFTAYAGCDHLYTTCDTKFDNLSNCKAHPNIPKEDDNPLNETGMLL